jgi:hypothetical protein
MQENMNIKDLKERSNSHLYLATFLILVGFILLFIFILDFPPGWDFRNNLYLPVKLLVEHKSPYNIHVLVKNSNAVWLPMALGFFSPLGFLSLQEASDLWTLINIFALTSLLFVVDIHNKPPLMKLFFTGIIIFLIPSTLTHFNLGQISILICLTLVIIINFDEEIPLWVKGFLFAFTLTKPQISVFLIPSYFVHVFHSYGWRSIIKLGCWTFLGVLILSLPVVLSAPDWFIDLIANLRSNPVWEQPSFFIVFFSRLSDFGQLLRYIFLFGGIFISIFWVNQSDSKDTLFWILALTSVFSPYIWSWDFVILYPLMIHSLLKEKRAIIDLFLFSGYFIIVALYTSFKIAGQFNDAFYWWIPWSIFAVTYISQWLSERSKITDYQY